MSTDIMTAVAVTVVALVLLYAVVRSIAREAAQAELREAREAQAAKDAGQDTDLKLLRRDIDTLGAKVDHNRNNALASSNGAVDALNSLETRVRKLEIARGVLDSEPKETKRNGNGGDHP